MARDNKKEPASVNDYKVIQRPVITEKSSLAGEDGRTVVFKVARSATKTDIRRAIERAFKVEVVAVRTANYLGKLKRTTRSAGHRAAFKKAYVTLKEGHSIDIVEGL
ncbi:MAG: 50S ribosomal protein L23 [Candidatus Dadabacteria bacterium]|nr:MAG: 50S ribosomal protein L23 [Candidatus Dadabacteria bacterium]